MPGISHLTGSTAAITKYLENKKPNSPGAAGYYDHGSAPSTWHGRGAEILGLKGAVDATDFSKILSGRFGNIDVSKRGGIADSAGRKAADLTFKAPKSVSLLALVHGDKRLIEAHEKSVAEALSYIEKEVVHVRRGKGGVIREGTDNLIAAVYLHEDSRAIDGIADPLLHSHAVIANMTRRADGTWSKLKFDFGLKSEKLHLSGDVYYSTLAREIKKLGYDVERKNDAFEIAGVGDREIAAFSRRVAAVDSALAEIGESRETASARQKSAATMASRGTKTQMSRSDQRAEWRDRAREMEIDLGAVFDRSENPEIQSKSLTPEQVCDNAIRSAVRHLSERNTLFTENQIKSEALRASFGDSTPTEIAAAIRNRPHGLVFAGELHQTGGRAGARADKFYTSDIAILREAEILVRAREGRGRVDAIVSGEAVEAAIGLAEARQEFGFSAGQKSAVALAISNTDRHIGVVGAAGAGKTTAMRAIVDEYRAAGYEIVGVAPSSKASQELKSAGCDTTVTLAKALKQRDAEPDKPRLYMLDEAGMVSARDYTTLYSKIEREGARSISVGDYRQLASVEAGSPFEQLCKTRSISVAEIDEIQRQKNPALLEIVQNFAIGNAGDGVKKAMPLMRESVDFAREAARAYLDLTPTSRDSTIMMTTTNTTRQAVNREIRAGLVERGAIGREQIEMRALEKVDFTREEYKRADKYEPGMIVRASHAIHQGKKFVASKDDLTVKSIYRGTLNVVDRNGVELKLAPKHIDLQAYRPKKIDIGIGDRIVFRDNDSILNIENGYSGIVRSLNSETGIVEIHTNGRDVKLGPERLAAIDYAYCRTIHSAQGATFDKAILIGESAKVATAQLAYVGISRARHDVEIYTDSAKKLGEKWEKWAERKTAIESISASQAERYMTVGDDITKRRQAAEIKLSREHEPSIRKREIDEGIADPKIRKRDIDNGVTEPKIRNKDIDKGIAEPEIDFSQHMVR